MKNKNGIREAAKQLNKRKKCKYCGGKGCSKCMKTGMQVSTEEYVKRKTGSQMSKAESKRLKNVLPKID